VRVISCGGQPIILGDNTTEIVHIAASLVTFYKPVTAPTLTSTGDLTAGTIQLKTVSGNYCYVSNSAASTPNAVILKDNGRIELNSTGSQPIELQCGGTTQLALSTTAATFTPGVLTAGNVKLDTYVGPTVDDSFVYIANNASSFASKLVIRDNGRVILVSHGGETVGLECDGASVLVASTTAATFYKDVSAPSYTTTSDDRWKFQETLIQDGLEIVRQLSPQTYVKVVEEDLVEELTDATVTRNEAGLIAQELYQVLPDAVNEGTDTTPWTVDYNYVMAYALSAIKDLDRIVQQQATRIAALEAKKTRTSKT